MQIIATTMENTTTTNTNIFQIDERCKTCFLKTYFRLFEKFAVPEKQQNLFINFYNEFLTQNNSLSTPEIQRHLSIKFSSLVNIVDLFANEKKSCNNIALKLYDLWKPKIENSNNPFDLALRLSIAGNIMDYGANNNFDINTTINNVLTANLAINKTSLLKEKISSAKKILYLGDNAGEIVFDKLFIQTMKHNNVTYVVKNAPILNDVTIHDAEYVEMSLVANVISNGYDAPSTILHKSSSEFLNHFYAADLIISKGQGNLEGLIHQNDKRIFFLLMVKCDVIAEIIGVNKGDIVVYN